MRLLGSSKHGFPVVLLLLLVTVASCDGAAPALAVVVLSTTAKVLGACGMYSWSVDVYATRKVQKMQKVLPSGFDSDHDALLLLSEQEGTGSSSSSSKKAGRGGVVSRGGGGDDDRDNKNTLVKEGAKQMLPSSSAPRPVQELRSYISKATNLVERPKHRRYWNDWIRNVMVQRATPTNWSPPSSSSCGSDSATTYGFAYRSYVNDEEKGVICKALKSPWYLWKSPFQFRGIGKLTFHNNKEVVNVERFWGPNHQPMRIAWYGHVVQKNSGGRGWLGRPLNRTYIEWTRTELVLESNDSDKEQVIPNPPQSEALRQIPWEILTEEDGMMLFRRGSVGVLAYDRQQKS